LALHYVEYSWELFRHQHFLGWEQTDVSAALGEWSRRHAIEAEFVRRRVQQFDVIYVVVRAR
jgi:hypothetical protein